MNSHQIKNFIMNLHVLSDTSPIQYWLLIHVFIIPRSNIFFKTYKRILFFLNLILVGLFNVIKLHSIFFNPAIICASDFTLY